MQVLLSASFLHTCMWVWLCGESANPALSEKRARGVERQELLRLNPTSSSSYSDLQHTHTHRHLRSGTLSHQVVTYVQQRTPSVPPFCVFSFWGGRGKGGTPLLNRRVHCDRVRTKVAKRNQQKKRKAVRQQQELMKRGTPMHTIGICTRAWRQCALGRWGEVGKQRARKEGRKQQQKK